MMPQRRTRIRVALWTWYRGDCFRGFQAQPGGGTVQQALQAAIASSGVEAGFIPAGRTDRGVHARMQVVGVKVPRSFPLDDLVQSVAGRTDLGICVARPASRHFHPQWSATGKEYRYRLCLGPSAPLGWSRGCWRPSEHPRLEGRSISRELFCDLIRRTIGDRDFYAFHDKSSPRRIRRLERVEVRELSSEVLEVRLIGDGFARYQARFLVGSAIAAAAGVISPSDFLNALDGGSSIPGIRAPGEGLILWEVRYPDALDPFSGEDRATPPRLPQDPPFID